jgi:TonB family protein
VPVVVHSRIGTQPCELLQAGLLLVGKNYAWIRIDGRNSETYSPEMGPYDYLTFLDDNARRLAKEPQKSGFEVKAELQGPADLPVVRALQVGTTCASTQDAIDESDQARKHRRKEVQGKLYNAGSGDITPPVVLKEQPTNLDHTTGLNVATNGITSKGKRGSTGTASLIALIDIDGTVKQTKIVRSSNPDFGNRAAEVVARWKFEPARKKGLPVPSYIPVEVNFRLY